MTSNLNNWKTILTFEYPTEAVVIRSRLEAEGIECYLKDELTAQVNPYYSNAIGGVKLQVKESDLTDALTVLKLAGYWQEPTKTVSKTAIEIDRFTSKIPLFNKLDFIPRMMLLVSLIIGIQTAVVMYLSRPNMYGKLTGNFWCVDFVEYENKVYKPETMQEVLSLNFLGVCEEYIELSEDYSLRAPGFKTPKIRARWRLIKDDSLIFFNANKLNYIYDGTYHIHFKNNQLILKSETATLHCHQNLLNIDF